MIVAAPTVHADAAGGGRYVWQRSGDVQPLPGHLVDLLWSGAMPAVSDEMVEQFLVAHTTTAGQELLDRWEDEFFAAVRRGESRHDTMLVD